MTSTTIEDSIIEAHQSCTPPHQFPFSSFSAQKLFLTINDSTITISGSHCCQINLINIISHSTYFLFLF